MLDERKRSILRAIIENYVQTAEPVGSRTIARKHNLGVSSATIRNEMADLEETGYLQQPHVSAGRIPSDKGYRFYVDMLMEPHPFSRGEYIQIQKDIYSAYNGLVKAIYEAARLVSLLTQSIAVVVAPSTDDLVFKHLHLVTLDKNSVLATLVLQAGIVKNKLIRTEEELVSEEVQNISTALSRRLKGTTYRDLGPTIFAEVTRDFGEIGRILVELVLQGLMEEKEEQVYSSGTVNIFNQPEFRDPERAKSLLETLEEKDHLLRLLNAASKTSGVQVVIGHENEHNAMQECSLVTCTYYVGGDVVGILGAIGPTRMQYSRVVSAVGLVAASLSTLLTE